MADTKISLLTDGGTIQATDQVPVARAGANNRVVVGTMAAQAASAVAITGGTITGITDLALADGGTGASLADPGADRVLFWDDSAGAVTWLTMGTNLTITDTTLDASGAGGATLDGITAATADQAGIANGDWNVRWNWAKTTNSEVAFEVGESAASTGGTSTSGVPNQVIAKFSTVATSTASPLSVYSRAAHVFSVSPTARQLLAYEGTSSAPVYSFAAAATAGMFYTSGYVALGIGTPALRVDNQDVMMDLQLNSISGNAAAPGLVSKDANSTGLAWGIGGFTGFSAVVAGVENARFTARAADLYASTAVATGYTLAARKSRGTVASPTVITTGDDLLTVGAYGYVGATGTYVEAANITFDSTGAIADNSTGVGGIIRFNTRVVGSAVAEALHIKDKWLVQQETANDPVAGDLSADAAVAMYNKNDKLVFAYNNAGTVTYVSIPLDGSTTTWTHSTTAP